MRITLAVAVACLAMVGFAAADNATAAVRKTTEIPAQGLGPALTSLAKEFDFQVLYRTEVVGTLRTQGVSGAMTAAEALEHVLNGTGLTYKYLDDKTVTITPVGDASVLSPQSSAPNSQSSPGGDHKKSFWDHFRLAQATPSSQLSPQSSVLSPQSPSPQSSALGTNTKQQDQSGQIEQIIVTAQKRSEDLQVVPVSVQVISGAQLEEQNQNSLTDLARTVPSLHISTGAFSNSLSMRGIGSGTEDPSYEQAVAMFADDIYRGRSRMSAATFLDLDRIEILKGPQSTFFGNNAIAGALNVISKKPGDTFDGYIRALGGMFEQYALEAAAGGPITDTLQARVAATADGNERGWLEDLKSGEHVPRIHNIAGRITLAYKPTEALDATLKLEGSHHKTEGSFLDEPDQWVNCPSPPFPTSYGSIDNACGKVIAGSIPQGFGSNEVSLLGGEQNQLSNDEGVLTLNYRRWNHTFTSVTGFSYYDFLLDANAGGAPTPSLQTELLEHYHQFSQEFRVTSPVGQPIEYLAGLYFQNDRLLYDQVVNNPNATGFFQLFPALVPYVPFAYRGGIQQREHIYSGFGSLTWNVTDRLKLTASLRDSHVDKDQDAHISFGHSPQLYGGFVEDPLPIQQQILTLFGTQSLGTSQLLSQSNHALMPSARIQYQFNPDVMGYFRYDRGFLSGGFNGADATFNFGQFSQFGPEYVNAYEVGFKSKWLNDTVLLNLDLFRADYTDLQVTNLQYLCTATGCGYLGNVANAAKSRSQGVEFEGQWVPLKDLSLGADVTYLRAYYVSYPNANLNTLQSYCSLPDGGPGSGTPYCHAQFPAGVPLNNDLSGQATAYAPKWSGSLRAAYAMRMPGDFRLTTELDPFFTTSYEYNSGDPFYLIPGYVRLDGRLTFGPEHGRWSLDLIGKNLTDRTIVVTRAELYQFSKEQPRNVALQFRAKF